MKRTNDQRGSIRGAVGVVCVVALFLLTAGLPAFGQQAPPPYPAPPATGQPAPPSASQPLLTPDQLDNLVAPIALYPDPMLGQVLAASTYPLEVVEAEQWLQQNGNLRGADLMNAARQQNWDPSIQALMAFPDVLATLNRDVRWTTDLGNAFLAQQQDVMAAVQRMRVRAQQNGRLSSNSQQTVTTQDQNGQSAVVIEPANPQVVYVPVYNPDYVWGSPVAGYYPPLWYPPVGYGFGFGPGIYLDAFFPGWLGSGWGGWGLGWGWGCGWFGGGLFVNAGFFNHFGFHGFYGGRFGGGIGGRFAWEHDAYHRAGVGYANRGVAQRFNNSRFAAGRFDRGGFNGSRSVAGSSARSFNGGSSFGSRGSASSNRGGAQAGGGWQHFGGSGSATARGFAPSNGGQSYRGNAGTGFGGGSRSYAVPRSYSNGGGFNGNARSYSGGGFNGGARSFSGGGFSGGSRSFSGGGVSGGRSFGGGGGGHSFGGGGGHAGGGGHGGGGHR